MWWVLVRVFGVVRWDDGGCWDWMSLLLWFWKVSGNVMNGNCSKCMFVFSIGEKDVKRMNKM